MSLGEVIIFIFVAFVFAGGIYGGLRLYRWNQRDRAAMHKKNKDKENLSETQ